MKEKFSSHYWYFYIVNRDTFLTLNLLLFPDSTSEEVYLVVWFLDLNRMITLVSVGGGRGREGAILLSFLLSPYTGIAYSYFACEFLMLWKWKLLICVQRLATPWNVQSWNSPGQNTGVGSCSLLQGIFPTQGLNPGLLLAGGFFTTESQYALFYILFSPDLSVFMWLVLGKKIWAELSGQFWSQGFK